MNNLTLAVEREKTKLAKGNVNGHASHSLVTYKELPRSSLFCGFNLVQISPFLLRQSDEECSDEWVVQRNWWRELLPLLLVETAHGAIPVTPLLASG